MGILSMISSVLRDATPGAIALRTGYLEGNREKQLDAERKAVQDAQLEETRARGRYYDANATGEPVQWVVDENGNRVPLPKRIRSDLAASTGASSPTNASTSAIPSFDPTPSARGIDRALQGGSIAENSTPAGGTLANMRNDVGSSSQGPTLQIGKPSGVKAPTPKPKYMPFVAEDGTVHLRNQNDPTDVKPFKDENGDPLIAHTPAGQQARTIVGADGFYHQWDSESGHYVNTHIRAPDRLVNGSPRRGGNGAGSTAQDRLDALAAIKTAQAASPRPSRVPEAQPMLMSDNGKGGVAVKPNPAYGHKELDPAFQKAYSDSVAYDNNTMAPLREHLRDVTIGPNTKIGRFTSPGAAAPDSTPGNSHELPAGVTQTGSTVDLNGGAKAQPAINTKAMEAEMAQASAQLQSILDNPQAPPEAKRAARAAYDKRQTAIVNKYGAARRP